MAQTFESFFWSSSLLIDTFVCLKQADVWRIIDDFSNSDEACHREFHLFVFHIKQSLEKPMGNIEPVVIDEDLLKNAVNDQAPPEVADVARKEGIDFKDVESLRLDYKSKSL